MSDEAVGSGSEEPVSSDEAAARRAAQDEVIVEALARGFSYPEAAAFGGVVARTVGRRMEDREFRRRVSLRRAEVVGEQTGLLVSASHEAIAVLQQEMRSAERSLDRVRAASLLLTFAFRFRHGFELENRLSFVEGRLGIGAPATPEDADGAGDDEADSDASLESDRNDDGDDEVGG
jgi:hypothetical protein